MDKTKEINRGYLDYIRSISPSEAENASPRGGTTPSVFWRSVSAVSALVPPPAKRLLKPYWLGVLRAQRFVRSELLAGLGTFLHQVLSTILLTATSVVMVVFLRIYLLMRRSRSSLNERAVELVPEFVEQYPFHLYPIVCKSFEFAFLEDRIDRLVEQRSRFIEMAVGEGTFSARIFPSNAGIVALDLSPYSLRKAVELPHIKQAIVCDCLRPPISSGHFDVILSNNFLHHVTMKEATLGNWSRIAKKLIFNENTPYWASGWVKPFMLKRLGFSNQAAHAASEIERAMLQHLESKEVIDDLVCKHYDVREIASYMSERTFFLCAVYSFIMRCFGPPTPPHLKSLFLRRPLRWLTTPLTSAIAKMLIRYDHFQDRSKDVFVSYVCDSLRKAQGPPDKFLICPDCSVVLNEADTCTKCSRHYPRIDQMLFLLPNAMQYVESGYEPHRAREIPKEHL